MSPRGSFGFASSAKRYPYFLSIEVLAQVVDRVPQPLHGLVGASARVRLGPLAPAPEDEDLRAELRADVHRAHRLLDRVRAHGGVVRRERAVAERRIEEQADGGHRDDQTVGRTRLGELLDDAVALGGRGVDRHEIVVVEVDAPGADLAEQLRGLDRGQWRTDFGPERIAAAIGDGPQAEGKLVLGTGDVVRHRRMGGWVYGLMGVWVDGSIGL